jgi:glucose-6-phosphate 1-dehydrogenase
VLYHRGQIEMTETETLQGRVQYFHSYVMLTQHSCAGIVVGPVLTTNDGHSDSHRTGIVRDVMVNHLHLLLGFTITPSMPLKSVSNPEVLEDQDRSTRLAFTETLRWSEDALRSWQYTEYRAHYDQDTKREDLAALFDTIRTPTAAQVTLTSVLPAWNTTLFTLAAAKAAAERQVIVRITFASAQGESTLSSPCALTVVIQRELNAHGSQHIEWSCEMVPPQHHHPPSGWRFINDSKRAMTPLDGDDGALQGQEWQLGDEVSAYDSLLWDAAIGDKSHFADIDEVLAAWNLWTPIAKAAQARWPATATEEVVGAHTYVSGTTPWGGDQRVDLTGDAKPPMRVFDEL